MATDPWPKNILHPFATVPPAPYDVDFYGPYNKLLYHLFPADTNFLVSPGRYPCPPRRSCSSDAAAVEFTVLYNDMPVLLLQVKAPDTLRWPSAREDAVAENRRRLRDLRPLCPLPKLYAVSAFGTKLRFYAANKSVNNDSAGGGVDPPPSPSDGRGFGGAIPLNRWNSDVLEEEGANLLKQAVVEIIARIYLHDGACSSFCGRTLIYMNCI
ncbi:hypothetical protein K438DRAFT_1584923 [Mycena galopus ATCC 62051]|nr:hypothetical protein K438DRAFT_1584923 [Mycena galopus ATCC 62051]